MILKSLIKKGLFIVWVVNYRLRTMEKSIVKVVNLGDLSARLVNFEAPRAKRTLRIIQMREKIGFSEVNHVKLDVLHCKTLRGALVQK